MKLSTAVIAALAAAVNVDAKTLDAKTLQKTMNKMGTKQSLLRRARKLDQQAQGDDAGQQEEFQITSDYSIKFNSCASLKILDVDDVSTYITNTQYSGSNVDLSSLNVFKDFIVFDATSDSSGQTVQFVIDVASYVQTLIQAVPDEYEGYCSACSEAYETCTASSVSAAGADEGGRKLTSNYETIDCDICYANGCFADGGNGDGSVYTDSYGYTSDAALEWLDSVTQCQEINQDNGYANFNGYYTLYAGLTCNAAGTGVEIGLFGNADCTLQSTQTSFSNILSTETQINSYFELTKTLVEHSFTQTTSCAETTFVSPYDNGNRRRLQEDEDENQDENQNENQDENQDANQDENQDEQQDEQQDENQNEQQDENQDANADANGDDAANQGEEDQQQQDQDQDPVNEICQALTADSFALQNCGQNNGNSYQYDDNGNAWGTYYYGSYGYINYDITDAEDADQICMAMQKKSGYYNRVGSGSNKKLYNYNGRKTNTYTWDLYSGSSTNGYNPSGSSSNSTNSGFDWSGTKQQIGDKYNDMSEKLGDGITRASEKTGLEVEEIIGIIVGAIAALCLFIACGCYCCCKKDTDEKQVNLLGEGRERREWNAKDKWETSRNKATWA